MQNASIFFGNVVDVNDDQKLLRIRASVNGYTNEISKDDLPWYYSFFGVRYLPVIGDVVPIIIFNNNFSTGMYGNRIEDNIVQLEGTEYENYVELYKRLGVQLTYKESTGIELINDKSFIQIEKEKIIQNVDGFTFTHVKDRFDLGTGGEATPLGDKTVAVLHKIVKFIDEDFTSLMSLFEAIKSASSSPFLAPIKIALTAKNPIEKSKHKPKPDKIDTEIDKIQSKKTFIE